LRLGGVGQQPITLQVKPDWRNTATAVGGIVSVLLVAAGLFYTNQANREQRKLETQEQVAERFSAAIDQLGQEGADKLSIRLGGIYGLQRLMRDSAPDEPAVIEVLSAFIRTHAPAPEQRPKTVPASAADVQAAVTVLAYRPLPHDPQHQRLNWAGTLLGLPHAALPAAKLADADLHDSALYHVDLTGAELRGANLGGSNLHDAKLASADLRGTDLHNADLRGADLRGANLSGANLTGADLRGAIRDESTQLPPGVVWPSSPPR
jgi:hypothetical protein